MNFGISFLPDADGSSYSASDYFQNALKIAKLADVSGMSTIKITEHYLHPYGGLCSSPLMFLSHAASVTKTIRLMTGCILPVFHHPIQIASHTSMLDAMSHGRLDVGFARAYLPYEFEAFGVNLDGSRERYEKTISTTIDLWLQENVNADTPYFSFKNASIFPRPVQKPHPPVWGAAVMSRQSFSWLGERGFHLLVTPPLEGIHALKEKIYIYLESFAMMNHPYPPKITLSMPLLLSSSQNEAVRLGERYLNEYLSVWSNACSAWSSQQSSDYLGYQHLKEAIQNLTPEKMMRSMQALIGTPEMVVDGIFTVLKDVPCTEIIWQIDFGAQPLEISFNTVNLFIQKVMPYVV